ncbi:hypothetical protein GCM10009304_01510 [Pseudomonas matsuisoli]|uniref:Uncharacterized protein n=1 Tax=Pseudomonas matsuisoli TaxID=1515666 RepID=A0A917PIA2_9PSED|nr:hypothetical protein GCM10009304_01510 [Pseudomonas matsuisoli]
MALLEFLFAAAWAWIVAAHLLQRIAYRLLRAVVAMRAMYVVVVIVVMVAVGAVYVRVLGHRNHSGR